MKKQSISNHLLGLVVRELNECLVGKRLDKVQQVGAELFKFSFSPGSKKLLIEPGVRIHLTEYDYKAPLQASNAAMFLRKRLKGKKLLSVEKKTNDRVVVFDFEEYFLIAEFFSHGNLVLTDKDYNILFTFRKEQWKDRELKKGVDYKFPSNPVKPKKDYSPLLREVVEKAESINKALDQYYSEKAVEKENPQLQKLRRRLEMQEKTIKEYEKQADEEKAKADWIYEKYELVEKALQLFKQGKKKELEEIGVKIINGKMVFEV